MEYPKNFLNRIKTLTNEIERLSKGEYIEINISENDEFAELSKAINNMSLSILQAKITNSDNSDTIKKEKNRLKIFKNALDESAIVAITDNQGTITYVNDKFCEISKYSRDELIGQNHRILKSGFHPPEFFDDLWKTISSGNVWKADVKNVAKGGSYYWVKTIIAPLLGIDGKIKQFIAIRTDITNQKKNEEELADMVKKLEESDLLKEEFSSMVTHELKTPLTPILGYCEMLMDGGFGSLTEDQLDYIKKIASNAKLLQRLIGDVLDVQKLDMSRMTFNKTDFEMDEFFDKLNQDSSHLMKDKGIEFTVTDSVKTTLQTDSLRLRQVFDNLIRNAVDFVPKEGGKIEVDTKKENGKIIFSVKDNGIGIPKDKQGNIFKKFYQVDTTHTRNHGGTGLGLVICKGIIKGLGGSISFESDPGYETTFYFDIPRISN